MKVTAHLLDGPVAGKNYATPGFRPELKFATPKPLTRADFLAADGPTMPTVDIEHHHYEAVEALVYYRLRGTETRS